MKEVIIKSKIVGKEGAIGSGKPIAFPDLSAYALRSDFIRLESSFNDFLNGDDTDNVINRWKELEAFLNNISEDYNLLSLLNGKADKATTLSGYGITDAYTKTNVDDLLKAYVTLSGSQTITGEKNFVGGLKVNGSPIYYDKDKKYWKLEGDLLVTGGVTMYGSDSSGGGLADAVAWGNVLGKPSWITDTTPSISISGTSVSLGGSITQSALRTALGLGSNAYTSTAYLPLSGGTIEGGFGSLEIKRNNAYASAVKYSNASGILGYIGINDDYSPMFWNKDMGETSVILHSGNIGSYNAGSATQVMINYSYNQDINYPLVFTSRDNIGIAKNGVLFIDFSGRPTYNPSSNTLSVGNILATGGITTNDSVTINGIKLSKSKDGVLYLDGNLVVKGGVTMYGTDATSSPSIIDSLPIASTSSKGIAQFNPSDFAVKDGVVSFVGSVDGGVASSVSWGNITGKPTFATVATSGKYSDLSGTPSSLPASDVYSWAKSATKPTYEWSEITSKPTWIGSSKPSYSYSEITGAISTTELQNYLTSNSYINVAGGDNRYLQLSGGTMKGHINIVANGILLSIRQTNGGTPYINFRSEINGTNTDLGDLGVNVSKDLVYYKNGWKKVWHEGNFTPSNYLPLSGGKLTGTIIVGEFTSFGASGGNFYIGSPEYPLIIRSNGTTSVNGSTLWHSGNDGSGSGLDADLLDGKHNGDLTAQYFSRGKILTKADTINKLMSGVYCYINGDNPTGSVDDNVILLAFRNESRNDMFQLAGAANTVNLYYRRAANVGNSYENWTNWEKIAFTSSNVASATKLQTARTIWGQSFDGTGDIEGGLVIKNDSAVYIKDASGTNRRMLQLNSFNTNLIANSTYDTVLYGKSCYLAYGTSASYGLILNSSGNVGIGTTSPQYKLDIVGNTMLTGGWYRSKGAYGWYSEDYAGGWYMTDAEWIRNYNSKPLLLDIGENNTNGIGGHRVGLTLRGAFHCSIMMIGTNGGSGYGWGIAANADGNFYVGRRTGESAGYSSTTDSYKFRLDGSGNGLFYGGVTMYSDKRKKTILNHVELSLKQIAEAPLIEHYYNGDEKRTTHVGSIAQYWASMNDWFCKLDSEGYYTMEIQNAALASAISIARELDRYESKTDKTIKQLKKRICQLEEEVERLRAS